MASLLSQLLAQLPDGVPIDSHWLRLHGVSSALTGRYVQSGYLQVLPHQAYAKSGAPVTLEGALYSLQVRGFPVWEGGLTALERLGLPHDVRMLERVTLYTLTRLPRWFEAFGAQLRHLKLFHEGELLKKPPLEGQDLRVPTPESQQVAILPGLERARGVFLGNLSLYRSSAERAILELLLEAPERSFEQLNTLFENLGHLRPALLTDLLERCTSIKVKRLFLYLARRHAHPWWPRLEQQRFELGSGKRQLYPAGQLDPQYLITVPLEREHVF